MWLLVVTFFNPIIEDSEEKLEVLKKKKKKKCLRLAIGPY